MAPKRASVRQLGRRGNISPRPDETLPEGCLLRMGGTDDQSKSQQPVRPEQDCSAAAHGALPSYFRSAVERSAPALTASSIFARPPPKFASKSKGQTRPR